MKSQASQADGKQKDRVASYAGGMLNRATSSGGTSIQASQKKKPYRARGCRGGASRKGRKKQSMNSSSQQNEENDPSRLNTNSGKRPCEGSQKNKFVATANKDDDTKRTSDGSDKAGLKDQDNSRNKLRSLSILPNVYEQTSGDGVTEANVGIELILPNGGGLNVHEGTSGEGATEANVGIDLLDESQRSTGSKSKRKSYELLDPVLPGVLQNSTIHSVHRDATAPSAISRPTSASSSSAGTADARDGISNGGFSFFCISPRSFLTGNKKAKH